MTRSEVALWSALRGKQLDGLRFRRQHPMGPYVVDFFCPSARLVVEVDGEVHDTDDAGRSDAVRDRRIEASGVRILRLPSQLVLTDMEGVLRLIGEAAQAAPR